MEKYIITTGKSIDLAIAAALKELRMDRDSVSVEVLENAKTGFLGIGACPAKVKVTYEVPDPKPAPQAAPAAQPKPVKPAQPVPALSSASRKPKRQAPRLEKLPTTPAPQPKKPAPPAQKAQPAAKAQAPKAPKSAPKAAPKAEAVQKEFAPAAPGSMEEQVEVFLKGLLERMGSNAVPHAFRKEENTISVELVGENLGMLIGRRGETLDAIQHLANYTVNRDADKRTRITIDAEDYRGKREKSLQQLARKMAGKVVKYRRNMTLEPMNAYERHVIHAALQDVPEVTTYSTGTEPNRRIVIAYAKDKAE